MTLANPEGANQEAGSLSKIDSFLNSERIVPTESHETEESVNAIEDNPETPDGDTKENRRRLKTKLDGREIEYEILSEINDDEAELFRLGTMMEQDYRKKTGSLADERRALEEQQSKVKGKISDLEEMLMFEAEWLDTDDAKELKVDDPHAYMEKYESIKRKAERLKEYRSEQQEKAQKSATEQAEAEVKKYSEIIPGWLDEKSRDHDLVRIESTFKDVGFNGDEIGKFWGADHRLMAIFRKAALYDDIKSKNLKDKEVVKKPKSTKPEAGNVIATSKKDEAKSEFRKNRGNKSAAKRLFDQLG